MSKISDYNWKPNSKPQELFLSLPDTVFECLYGGAVGGGKTEVLLHLPIVRKWIEHPKFQAIYFRESFPELEKSLIERGLKIYPKLGAKYNNTKHCFSFPSGAKIWFDYMESDSDADKHDTDEYNLIVWEELTAFSKYQYTYMFSRCRTSTPDLPAIVRAASNPGNVGHHWVRERFVDPCKRGLKLINDNGTKRIFIPAKATDNVDLYKNDPTYINRLQHLPETIRRAKIEGNWYILAGQVFDEFRDRHYPEEPSNALHVIAPYDIPEWWPKIISIDWGFTHKAAIYWAAISPDLRVIIYREMISQREQIAEWAPRIKQRSQFDGNIVDVVIDPSASQQRGTGKSIFEQVEEFIELPLTEADNDRIGGKMLLHEYLRWKQKEKSHIPTEGYNRESDQRIYRVYGENASIEYRKMFEPQQEESNIPKLQIFNTCTELIKTIPILVYEDSSDKKVEDVKKVEGDDPYDSLRYNLQAVHNYTHGLMEEFEERSKRLKIVNAFNETRDATSFYRAMEKLDAQNSKVVGVNTYRRKRRVF